MFPQFVRFMLAFVCNFLILSGGASLVLTISPIALAEVNHCPVLKSWEQRSKAGEIGEPDFYKEQTKTVLEWLTEEPENAKYWAMLGMAAEAHGRNYVIKNAWETLPLIAEGASEEMIEALSESAYEFQRNRQDFAIAASRNSIERDSDLLIPWVVIGSIKTDQEKYEEAIRHFREAASRATIPIERVMPMIMMAQSYEKMGEDEKAENIKTSLISEVVKMGGMEKLESVMNLNVLLFPECEQ